MGDALNVLSQGWEVPRGCCNQTNTHDNDRKSAVNLASGQRDVPIQDGYSVNAAALVCAANGCASFNGNTDLQINAAFVSGLAQEGAGVYNGGLENFPRFHESWSNRRLNYQGSFVTFGAALHQKNDWKVGSGDAGNIYDPPQRWWDYDADFNQVENLPPLTPMFTYLQQRLFTRFYQ